MKSLQLRTEVTVRPSVWKITHSSKIITLGSCFAEVLGEQLASYKFDVMPNPFGTIFNPASLVKLVKMSLGNELPSMGHFLQNQDNIYLHHDFHSSFWATDSEALDTMIRKKMADVRQFLQRSDVLVITLGSAFAYRSMRTTEYVTNCHKVPASQFTKELLSLETVEKELVSLIELLKSYNPKLRILLTVSPVRHTKDTLPLNQVSKSILRIASHTMEMGYEHVNYFPSYEIMIDDLRDYRFYEADLIHPNRPAEEHIFRTFVEAFLNEESLQLVNEWEAIQKMLNHNPQHGPTESHRTMLVNVKNRLEKLALSIDVSRELEEINAELTNFPPTN
jgi:lysophospholipase L1-like esterase